MPFTVHPLTPERWPDLEAIFRARGCAVARSCWCMFYRQSGRPPVPEGESVAAARRRAFRAVVDQGPPPGLIGYRDGQPVGWLALGPREDYAKLKRSPVMKPVDAAPVWSIICFVVPAEHRRQGVARGLLRAAIVHARQQGATLLEAYPVDRPEPSADDTLWFGVKSMFDDAGFAEVARRKPQRPVVRLKLVG